MKPVIEIITVVVFLGCLAMLAGVQQNSCYYNYNNDANYYPAESYTDSFPPPVTVADTISMAVHNR